MTLPIEDLERLAALGWQAPEECRLGDWVLRAADGFTGRANSALAVGDPGLPLAEAIDRVSDWYRERGLRPMICVPHPTDRPHLSSLDRFLADRGWPLRGGAARVMTARAEQVSAQVMTARAEQVSAPRVPPAETAGQGPVTTVARPACQVDVADAPDDSWLALYHPHGQHQLPPVAVRLLTSAPWQAFGSIRAGDRTIAIGRVSGNGSWAGLTAIEVGARHRRRGLATALVIALTNVAAGRGADHIYLQVENENVAARTLYRRSGFADHHGYHFRMEPTA